MKAWLAVLSTLLTLLPRPVWAADDSGSAARELARKTVALVGRGEPFSATWRNLSSLPVGEFNQARSAFEAAVREAGGKIGEIAPTADARLTLSENAAQFLLVEEVRKGEERQVWMLAWKRVSAAAPSGPAITLEKKLVWEQANQILDVAFFGDSVMALSASEVTLQTRGTTQTAPLTVARSWPRDLRGRLTSEGSRFKAYLPGVVCPGAIDPVLTVECSQSAEAWPLDMAAAPLAAFAAGRNYFDGRITLPPGARKTLAPFFSAAKVGESGRTYWLLAMVDGRAQILDGNFELVGSVTPWGSDIAATEARCGGGSQVLATKAGDQREPDTLRAFGMVNHAPVPLSEPLDLPGPVTALWSLGGSAAVAVVHNLATGNYQAFVITVNCGG